MTETHTSTEQVISYDDGVELIDESTILKRTDLGYAFLYRLQHPKHGQIAVLNSSVGDSVLLLLEPQV